MAFAFVATSANSSSSANTLTVDKPTGTTNGDIMLAYVAQVQSLPNSTPAGWSSLGTNDMGGGVRFVQLFYKIASSEGANYTWGFATTDAIAIVIASYRGGFNTSDPIDVVSNTQYITDNNTLRAASMTVASANSALIFMGGTYNPAKTFTAPTVPTSDWAENYDASYANSYSQCIYSMVWTSSGASGDMDVTLSGATLTRKHAFAVALKPLVTTTKSAFFFNMI